MRGAEWRGEIVTYRGQLWTVYGITTRGDDLWLLLMDHYGTDTTCAARAEDVEVALQ